MEAHAAQAPPAPPRARQFRVPGVGAGLGRGVVVLWLSLIVLLPLAALVDKSFSDGLGNFWESVSTGQAKSSLELILVCSLIVVAINGFFGTIVAWLLVRDNFRGKSIINAIIDLPFALPTIVASLILIELWGKKSPVGIDIALTRTAIVVALCFVTLPFVVRAVQPLLIEMDKEMEEAAASLGAGGFTIFRRVIFPNLLPGLAAGVALAFARALGEYGSVLLFAGGKKETQVASIFIGQQIESGNETGAAAVSVVLLIMALVCLLIITLVQRWGSRHERAQGAGAGGLTIPMSGVGIAGSAEDSEAGADDLDTGAPGNPPEFPKDDDQRG
jgi:sulfate/thiosulfate transport system permease protein